MTRRSMHLFPDNEEIMELISIVKKMISMIQSKGMPITMNTLYSLTKEEGKERNVSSVEVKLDTLGPVYLGFLRAFGLAFWFLEVPKAEVQKFSGS